jgi:hypothetical protein
MQINIKNGTSILKNVVADISYLEHEIRGSRAVDAQNSAGPVVSGDDAIKCTGAESVNVNDKTLELLRALNFLQCEVLNSLGNTYRIRDKQPKEAVKYYRSALEAAETKKESPNFVSHNLGLSILELTKSLRDQIKSGKLTLATSEATDLRGLLIEAQGHLERALKLRSQVAHSKSFVSVLRLCDTHRTLHDVVVMLQAMEEEGEEEESAAKDGKQLSVNTISVCVHEAAAAVTPSNTFPSMLELISQTPDGTLVRVEDLHRGRLATLGLLRRCPRTWEDHKLALSRLCEWMRLTGPFLVYEYDWRGRFTVEMKWRSQGADVVNASRGRGRCKGINGGKGSTLKDGEGGEVEADSEAAGGTQQAVKVPEKLNQAFFQLDAIDTARKPEVELASEMFRALTNLRLSAGAGEDLVLAVDPATLSLYRLAKDCLNKIITPAQFSAAGRCIRAVIHGGVGNTGGGGGGAEGRQWRARVERSLRELLSKAAEAQHVQHSTSLKAASQLITQTNSEALGRGLFLADPEMYVARLIHLSHSDLPEFSFEEKAAVLRATLASVSAWCTVSNGWGYLKAVGEAGGHGPGRGQGLGGEMESILKDEDAKNSGNKSAAIVHNGDCRPRSEDEDMAYRRLLLIWFVATAKQVT